MPVDPQDTPNVPTGSPPKRARLDRPTEASAPVDDVPPAYRCGICADLLYKPVVLTACGHAYCVGCHDRITPSDCTGECAYCKTPCPTDPMICERLHRLCAAAFPAAFERRRLEEAERRRNYPKRAYRDVAIDGRTGPPRAVDLTCDGCGLVLLDPVVPHCGQVLCRGCFGEGEGLAQGGRACPVCRIPTRSPVVGAAIAFRDLLDLLPEGDRRPTADDPADRSPAPSDLPAADVKAGFRFDPDRVTHYGFNCDMCGATSLEGIRFHCVECPSPPGYDFCEECHRSASASSEVPRSNFDVGHTAAHRYEEIASDPTHQSIKEMVASGLPAHFVEEFINKIVVPAFRQNPGFVERAGENLRIEETDVVLAPDGTPTAFAVAMIDKTPRAPEAEGAADAVLPREVRMAKFELRREATPQVAARNDAIPEVPADDGRS